MASEDAFEPLLWCPDDIVTTAMGSAVQSFCFDKCQRGWEGEDDSIFIPGDKWGHIVVTA